MTYATQEESIESGRPLHFYRFTLANTIWRYTSADEDITRGGFTWRAVPIEDSGVSQTGEIASDTLSITSSWTIGPAQVYMSSPPSEPIIVERLASHVGITDLVVNYVGEILQVNFPIPGSVTISAHTLSATMRRAGLRLGWQRTCPYALYDQTTCKVDPLNFAAEVKVESIDGFDIVVSGLVSGANYQGGYYEWTHHVRGIQRTFIGTYNATGVIPPTVLESYSFVTPGNHTINVPTGTTLLTWSVSGAGGGGSGGQHGYTIEYESSSVNGPGRPGNRGGNGQLLTGLRTAPTIGATLSIFVGEGGIGGGVGPGIQSAFGLPGSAGQVSTLSGDSLAITANAGPGGTSLDAGASAGTGAAGGAGGTGGSGNPYPIGGVLAGNGQAGANGAVTISFSKNNTATSIGTLTAFGDTSEIHAGMLLTIYPGCQRTVAACVEFNNLDNYGGFPLMPGKSPFDGTPFF